MKTNISLEDIKSAIMEIYNQYGASAIASGESMEHYLATLSGVNSAVIMMVARLFNPELAEMDEIEKLNDAGQQYAIDMVRNHYQRIVSQIR